MTTSYVCKRCKSIAFAKGFEYLNVRFTDEELSEDNVLFIGEEHCDDDTLYPWMSNPININDIEYIDSNKTPLVVVQLGIRKNHTITVPTENPGDNDLIDHMDCTKLKLDDDAIAEFKEALITYLNDPSFLSDKSLSKEFSSFITHAYCHIKDGNNKLLLLRLLNQNNIDTSTIEISHPIVYHEIESEDVVNTTPFDDIKIIINKDDSNASSSSAIYRHNADDLKKAAVGNSTQLEAFSKNKFTVIHNKKSANIENRLAKRNHDVLDSLARNGVVCSPNTEYELSIHTLMKKLRRFKSFDIVFIHPSYDLKITRAEYPSELIEPSYLVNEGEILAVAYRFISIHYFGYCSVYNEEMEEFSYLI